MAFPDSDCPPPLQSDPSADLRLRLLATSDLHANLLGWDYDQDRSQPRRGLACTAGLVAAARAEQANCLLFDNGDFLQGSPLGDFIALERGLAQGDMHPVIAAMNLLGYDAATLGNHEFSHGLGFLLRVLRDAAFPIVSSNILWDDPGTEADRRGLPVVPHVLLHRVFRDEGGRPVPLGIGVLGLCPPQVLEWEAERLTGRIRLCPIVEAGRAAATRLRGMGADLVVALSHSGIAAPGAADQAENASLALAAAADVDALITGHTHEVFPRPDGPRGGGIDTAKGTLAGKPAVMPGFFGSHLGVIDLHLRRKTGADGGWQVVSHLAAARPVAARDARAEALCRARPDPGMAHLAMPAHLGTRAWIGRPVGRTALALSTHFALVTETAALRLVAEAQIAHVRRALENRGTPALPVLAAVAPFKSGGRGGPDNYADIAPGPLTMRHMIELYPHPNTLVALQVTGAELTDWLERGAALFHQIRPGAADQPLTDPAFPAFNFDTVHGVTWTCDLASPARFDSFGGRREQGGRIRDLRFRGRPVAPGDAFILATNSYRAGGGGGFPATGPAARVVLADRKSSRDILIDHVAAGGQIGADFTPGWRLGPLPGTSVLLDTAPGAASHAGDIAALRPEDLGLDPATGFRRFRLRL